MRNTIEPGWASAAEKTSGKVEENLKKIYNEKGLLDKEKRQKTAGDKKTRVKHGTTGELWIV